MFTKETWLELFTISNNSLWYYMPSIMDMRETFACSRLSRNVLAYTSPARTVAVFRHKWNWSTRRAPYERRLWITKSATEKPNQIWNRFYISRGLASWKTSGRANSYLALVFGIQKCNDTSNWALETESLAVFIASTKTFLQAALLLVTNVHSSQCALLEERHTL